MVGMVEDKTLKRIQNYVVENPGHTEEEIAEALGISLFDAIEGLLKLEKAGKLKSVET